MNSAVKISLVTPAYNRADELDALITSIATQSFDLSLIEHIISDDGSTDRTAELVSSRARKLDYPLIYINQENRGPGAARNHGIEKARGELILFIDSDCEAHPDWIRTIWDVYTSEGFDACGGPDGSREDFTSLQKAIDYSMTSFLTTGGMRGHSEKMVARFYPRTHNMGATRTICKKVGGFGDLRHGQDIEFSHRIRKAGGKIRFIKDSLVYHRRRTSLKQFFKQVFNWGVARINLGKISPDLLEPVHFLPAVATILTIIVIAGSFSEFMIFKLLVGLGLLLLTFFSISAWFVQKDLKTGLWVLIVTPIQIFGYGSGFMVSIIKRYIFRSGEWKGFSKKYYN